MVIPIHDRNPVRRTTWVTYGLIAVNVVVFLAGPESGLSPFFGSGHQLACAQALYDQHFAAIPREMLSWHALSFVPAAGCPPPGGYGKVPLLSVLTAMFIHANWLHLGGNMLFLYVFGNNVEDRLGSARFLVFYLLSGYVSMYGYALSAPGSSEEVLGASGAIAGTLGAYLFLFPRAKVIGLVPFLFYIPLRLPAWLVLGFWFMLQWLAFQGGQGEGSVAYAAHVVGFAAGFTYAWLRYGQTRHPPAAPDGPPESRWAPPQRALPWSEQWSPPRRHLRAPEDPDAEHAPEAPGPAEPTGSGRPSADAPLPDAASPGSTSATAPE